MLIEYKRLYRIERVRHIGYAKALRTGKVIYGPAFLNGKAPFHTIVHHAGKKRQGTSLGMGNIDGIVRIYQQLDHIIHLLLISIVKFFKIFHFFYRLSGCPHLYASVPAAGKYQFHRTAHIEERRIVPSFCLAGFLGFHAADDIVFPRILQSKPTVH